MIKVTHIIQNLALTCFKQLQSEKKKLLYSETSE